MQLTSRDCDSVGEGEVAPYEDIVLCRSRLRDNLPEATVEDMSALTTSTSNSTTTSPPPQSTRPECLNRHQTTTGTSLSSSSSPSSSCHSSDTEFDVPCGCGEDQLTNHRKRKLEDDVADERKQLGLETNKLLEKSEAVVSSSVNVNLERYRRLLMARRRLLSNLAQMNNVPLFYLYGDLLLIPKYKWGSGMGIEGGRRRSLNDHNLTTPIDSGTSLEASSHPHPRTKTPSLVQVCPDSQSLEKGGFSPEWFDNVIKPVMNDLNRYGVCVVDNFLGAQRAEQILSEVGNLHSRGVFHDGQVVSRNVQDQARGIIRGDKITWVTGSEHSCSSIGQLVSVVDTLIAKANKHQDAGELANYSITWRTRAMVACYPGQGTHYVKHVDNPDGDGRCITAIYYINKDWVPEDGGILRIYPEGSSHVAEITPDFDRMLFFWSDRRNPHEVLPAKVTRYAITVWYLDQREREEYLSRVSRSSANT